MPCSDGGRYCSDDPELREKLDKVTRLLCGLCGRLIDAGKEGYIHKNKELSEWWEEHQRIDAARLRMEAMQKKKEGLRKLGLSKLTAEERQALGI